MTRTQTSRQKTLARAQEELQQDHTRIDKLGDRLRAARDLPSLLSALEELHQTVAAHFVHEETTKGLYDTLGLCAPQHRAEIRELVNDHRRIAVSLRRISKRAREGMKRPYRELREEAMALLEEIQAHEAREHEIAHQALSKT